MPTHAQFNLNCYHKRIAVLKEYLGGVCIKCGANENLQFHHKTGETKLFTIARRCSYSLATVKSEVDKCELLCNRCHIKEHNCDHGSLGKYRHAQCRCDLCKHAYNEYQKLYKRKRRAAGTM